MNILKRSVGALMTRNVVCATPDMTLEALASELVRTKLSGLPVVDAAGTVVGIVSKTDLLYLLETNRSEGRGTSFAVHSTHEVDLEGRYDLSEHIASKDFQVVSDACVEDIMTRQPHTIGEDSDVKEAARIMADEHVHRLPVVDKDKVVGLISSMDVLRWLADYERI